MQKSVGRPAKYPWDTWVSRLQAEGQLLLLPGQDFSMNVSPATVRSSVLTQMKSRGLVVRTALYGTGLAVYYLGAQSGDSLDWSALLDGEIHQLKQGVDFAHDSASMVEQILRMGHTRGVQVRVRADADTVAFRAILNEPAPTAERVDS